MCSGSNRVAERLSRFRRVIVWGHPLHSHTHSYVHAGFARAFEALGAETIWTGDRDALERLDLSRTLFLTEGQVVDGLPLRRDCAYVLHNVADEIWQELDGRCLRLQVLSVAATAERRRDVEQLDAYTYVENPGTGAPILYQPWATDLLPSEFDFDVPAPRWPDPAARIVWVGTIGRGQFGNVDELAGFRRACEDTGVKFVHRVGASFEENQRLIRSSLMAPAIVGRWQVEHGYVPCRIFKNISYGRLGLTNSEHVQAVFDEEIACSVDTSALFQDGLARLGDRHALLGQMREVQARHTYVQRIARILEVLP
jgi:hypothetical protein